MRGCSSRPWILFSMLALVSALPAFAETPLGAGKKGGSVSVERAEGLPRTENHLEPAGLIATQVVASAPVAAWNNHPHRRPRHRGHRSRDWAHPESYMLLKGGGLFVAEQDGVYLGIEAGGAVDDVLDFGVSLDYFHRSSSERVTLEDTQFEDLPVEVVATLDESSAHLVPLGVTLRVRLPIGGDAFSPFVSGTAAYETLFLNNVGDPSSDDPILRALEENETFGGFGWQAAAGVDMRLSPTLGVFGEIGMHRSSPSKEIHYEGFPVDLRVDLDGAFLRGGLRLSL